MDLWGFNLATLYLLCFQTNCSVRNQLLSFYVKNVFSHLGVGSDKSYIISAFQVLQVNMNACVSMFLRVKLTLSRWKAREGFHHSFSADKRGWFRVMVCPRSQKTKLPKSFPLGLGKFNTAHFLVGWACREQAMWWRYHGDKPLPCCWCCLVLSSQH